MLAGTIYSCKRFLVKQTAHTMTTCYLLENTHHDLVVVCSDIYRCIDRCQLMLCRSNFIVLCLCRYSQFPALFIYFFHVGGNSLTDRAKIVVVHLLSFRRHCAKKSSAGIDQIFSLKPFFFIYKEVFLFCTYRWCYFLRCRISKKSEKS